MTQLENLLLWLLGTVSGLIASVFWFGHKTGQTETILSDHKERITTLESTNSTLVSTLGDIRTGVEVIKQRLEDHMKEKPNGHR